MAKSEVSMILIDRAVSSQWAVWFAAVPASDVPVTSGFSSGLITECTTIRQD